MKTIDYLNLINKKHDASDYKIAQLLDVSKQTVSRWRNEKGGFDDELCLKVADLVSIPPEKIIADMHAERAKNKDVKKVWQRLSAGIAASVILSLALFTGIGFNSNEINELSYHSYVDNADNNMYYAKLLLLLFIAWALLSRFRHFLVITACCFAVGCGTKFIEAGAGRDFGMYDYRDQSTIGFIKAGIDTGMIEYGYMHLSDPTVWKDDNYEFDGLYMSLRLESQ